MRIATWNVNSLKARLERVMRWLERAKPDVLLMQETKLADVDAPADVFGSAGYALAHHGEGRWNGVAIASRCGIGDVVTNFGEPLRAPATPEVADDEPLAEARMISAVCGGPSGLSRRGRRQSRWCSAAISTSRRPTQTSGTPRPVMAARTSRSRSARRSAGSVTGA
jgi:hypothetical protein